MKKYQITVNGKSYEVEVQEIGGAVSTAPRATSAPAASVPAPTPVAKPAAAPASAPAEASKKESKPAPAGGVKVNAPMPGTILDVRVTEGQTVKKGQVLTILEAMKMENEIMAPQDGVVASVQVSKGASVNTGELLVVLE